MGSWKALLVSLAQHLQMLNILVTKNKKRMSPIVPLYEIIFENSTNIGIFDNHSTKMANIDVLKTKFSQIFHKNPL